MKLLYDLCRSALIRYSSNYVFEHNKASHFKTCALQESAFDLNQKQNTSRINKIETNLAEINYALNLCKIYRNLIEKFESLHEKDLGRYADRFHRFFYIGGLLSSFACGKSFYSTDVAFYFTVHYPEYDAKYNKQAELHYTGYNQGHLAHFRHVNEFHKSSQKEISITELILDLNYLNCYYKPIVEKHSGIKLF